MRIGFVIGRIGGVDGVALETEKWIRVLDRMGHSPVVLTGELEAPLPNVTLLPELAFSHPDCVWGQEMAFFEQTEDERILAARLEREAAHIEEGIRAWIRDEQIEALVIQNASCLPCHITMGMALRRVMEDTEIPSIAHDHDFAWERGERYQSGYECVQNIIASCFPPRLPNLEHAVINSYSKELLARRFCIDAILVPNVMDFEEPFGGRDDYNRELSRALACDPDDILLFQVTRVVRRKGIESAIELVHRLANPRVKLVLTGPSTDDRNGAYGHSLEQLAGRLGIENRVLFAGSRFSNVRGQSNTNEPVFSLSDAYAAATACTYFSSYEGFGNAFVEAVVARKPIFVNNYKPVYWPDIGSKGFRTVQIEDNRLTKDRVAAIGSLLDHPDQLASIGDHNHELGRQHFSFDVLERHLAELLGRVTASSVSSRDGCR